MIVCYSLIDWQSYENVKIKWIPELKHYCPDAAYLLVGTKNDLTSNYGLCIDKNKDRKPKHKKIIESFLRKSCQNNKKMFKKIRYSKLGIGLWIYDVICFCNKPL